jgi:hypothetical protein
MVFLSPVGLAGERKTAGCSVHLSPSSIRVTGEGPAWLADLYYESVLGATVSRLN